ncbi:MAG: VacJ family lipoprotein, partial [Pseudomonadota bacterium]
MWKTMSKLGVALLVVGGLGACASTTATTSTDDPFAASDPYENTNRRFHRVNLALDRNVLRPVAQGYDTVTPEGVQFVIGNAINHIELPRDFANQIFQGSFIQALKTFGRFSVNTILGAGGLLDPASELGLGRESTDFGITLGKWGVNEGPYLELPLLGPSNPRDLVGTVVDRAFAPTTYISIFTDTNFVTPAIGVVTVVDRRNRNADLI